LSFPKKKNHKISSLTGISIVLANMIGTGVFTSLGFQLNDISNISVIITVWVLGGIFALSGAFSYAEIGTNIKKSGGEYAFLSEIYNPLTGYLSGWISMTVGFAAPIVLSALAFVEYLPFKTDYPKILAAIVILGITFIHSFNLKVSSGFQNISTFIKIALIVVLIALGFYIPSTSGNTVSLGHDYFSQLGTTAFVIALIYVTYSYSGWNASAYITEEFKTPKKSLLISLLGGTFLVTILYTLLQIVFLRHASISELSGQINVGTIAVKNMLGDSVSKIFSAFISVLLLSGISAMIWIGSRVTASIANDHQLWKPLQSDKNKIPVKSLWFQSFISIILLLSGTFEQILIYCGILLTLSSAMTVLGVFIIRSKNKNAVQDTYKSPLFPFFQILFLFLSLIMIVFAIIRTPKEIAIGFMNLIIGLFTFYLSKKMERNIKNN